MPSCELYRGLHGIRVHITQDNHEPIHLLNQPLQGVIRDIGRGTVPPHDQPPLIEEQTEFTPNNPAVVREAFAADLLRTPAFAYGVDQLDTIRVDLDEVFALLSAVKDGEVSAAEAIARLERSPQWVWAAMDPESKLLLTIDVGERTLAMAQRVVHHVAEVLAPDCAPLFLTDGFREYLTALLTHYGSWVQPPRRQAKGSLPKPRWMPLPQLLYAQVVKTVRRRRLVRVRHRVVFGTLEAVQQVLAACGWQINTSFVERLNLTIRQHVAAIGRRVSTLCKGEEGLRQQLALYHTYYNFCLPHASLRQALPQPEATHGTGSAKQWGPCTPAMSAGLTDRVWTLREVLLYRVPPWPQPVGVGAHEGGGKRHGQVAGADDVRPHGWL